MFYKIRDFIRRHFIGYRPSDMPCIDYLESKGAEKMKIIELLNRIAKDEGIPVKIKFKGKEYEWSYEFFDYKCIDINYKYLVEDLETEDLNRTCEEIPIIEDKKIEKIEKIKDLNSDCYVDSLDCMVFIKEIALDIKTTKDEINEIIKKLNKEE